MWYDSDLSLNSLSLCCPSPFLSFFFLYSLTFEVIAVIITPSHFSLWERKVFFSPSVTLYLYLPCAVFHFLVSPHHTIFLLAFLPLPLSHGGKTTKSISRSLSLSDTDNSCGCFILWLCHSLQYQWRWINGQMEYWLWILFVCLYVGHTLSLGLWHLSPYWPVRYVICLSDIFIVYCCHPALCLSLSWGWNN